KRETSARAADLRRAGAVSLLKKFRESENDQRKRIKERVHRHGNENRSAPLVGKSETGSEDEERDERGQMRVHGSEEQRVENYAESGAEITLEHAVEEETKNEFL